MVAVALSGMDSFCPDPRLRTSQRVDPYWAGMWNMSSSAAWLSRDTALRRAQMGLTSLPKKCGVDVTKEASREALLGWGRTRRLRALSAVSMWRTMTVQQLASMTGHAALGEKSSADRNVLWCTGLIETGTVVSDSRTHLPSMVRTDPRGDFDSLAAHLSFVEQIGVTGGQPWKWGSQYDRHNILATELALRIAEFCPIGTVLGESMAGVDLLMGGDGSTGAGSRAGDLVVVRDDGLRIVIEATATVDKLAKRKIDRWAQVLAKRETKDTIVVFVELAHPDKRGRRSEVQRLLRKYVREVATESLEAHVSGVDHQLAVARWQDWFPEPGMIDSAFPALPIYRPTGSKGDPWEKVDALDPFDLDFDAGPDAQHVLSNARLLYGAPFWLSADREVTDVESWVRSRLDVTSRTVPAAAAVARGAHLGWTAPEPKPADQADSFVW